MNDQARLLFALQVVSMTRAQIEQFFEITTTAANKRLARLRRLGVVRICGWEPQPEGVRGKRSPTYCCGDPAQDVPEPPRESSTARNAAWRKRHPERFRQLRKAQNARQRERKRSMWLQLGWDKTPPRS